MCEACTIDIHLRNMEILEFIYETYMCKLAPIYKPVQTGIKTLYMYFIKFVYITKSAKLNYGNSSFHLKCMILFEMSSLI